MKLVKSVYLLHVRSFYAHDSFVVSNNRLNIFSRMLSHGRAPQRRMVNNKKKRTSLVKSAKVPWMRRILTFSHKHFPAFTWTPNDNCTGYRSAYSARKQSFSDYLGLFSLYRYQVVIHHMMILIYWLLQTECSHSHPVHIYEHLIASHSSHDAQTENTVWVRKPALQVRVNHLECSLDQPER